MRIIISIVLTVAFSAFYGFGDVLRTETFQLKEGWNAIYLSVEPVDGGVGNVFSNVAVDMVSSFDGAFSTQQFATDSTVNLLNELGWETWYAPSRVDSFLTTLGAVHCGKAYLVHALEDCVLSVAGAVEFRPVEWVPDEFNLVGFTLDPVAVPTYAEFFAGSPALRSSAIYCLRNGVWTKVLDPANTAMKSGEAFWIYCDGASDYPGPVDVNVGAADELFFREGDTQQVVVKNRTPYPLNAEIAHICPESTVFPLSIVVDVVGDIWTGIQRVPADLGDGAWEINLPPLAAGAGLRVPLQAETERLNAAEVESLLCIKSDLGTETWVPVTGMREDLK